MNRPISIVLARIIVWFPIFIILLIGALSVASVYNGLRNGSAYPIQNGFYLSIHEFFGWEHSSDNTLKAIIIGLIVFVLATYYITLYWQSGKNGNFKTVITLTVGTFVICIMLTYWFENLGYYFILTSILMLGLFLMPSSRKYYEDFSKELDENGDILDTKL